MEKKHELPEFQVILQNQANAKFFVASGGVPFPTSKPGTAGGPDPDYSATEGEDGGDPVW